MSTPARRRASFVALALGNIALVLAVHRGVIPLPPTARDVAGDALWAAMMFAWIGAVAPGARLRVRNGVALAICFGVELSQLVQLPALVAARATTLGHLVLGSDYDPRDFIAYAAGVVMAALVEAVVLRGRHGTDASSG